MSDKITGVCSYIITIPHGIECPPGDISFYNFDILPKGYIVSYVISRRFGLWIIPCGIPVDITVDHSMILACYALPVAPGG